MGLACLFMSILSITHGGNNKCTSRTAGGCKWASMVEGKASGMSGGTDGEGRGNMAGKLGGSRK